MSGVRIQSVLFRSPYSGCAGFSGWRPAGPPCAKAPTGTTWPPARNAPGAAVCCDRLSRHPVAPQTLQQAHFRPTRPYPGKVLGPTNVPGSGLAPMPPLTTRFIGKAPYDLGRGIRGPSSSGPFTVFSHVSWGNESFGVAGPGAGGHNLGLA